MNGFPVLSLYVLKERSIYGWETSVHERRFNTMLSPSYGNFSTAFKKKTPNFFGIFTVYQYFFSYGTI